MPLLTTQSARSFGLNRFLSQAGIGGFYSIQTYSAPSDIGTTISLTDIPQSYKDLVIILSMGATYGGSGGGSGGRFYFNADNASSYTTASLYGNGSTLAGGNSSQGWFDFGACWSGNTNPWLMSIWTVYDYKNPNKYKTVTWQTGANLLLTNGTNSNSQLSVGVYKNLNPITQLNFLHGAGSGSDGNLRSGSEINVFGIGG